MTSSVHSTGTGKLFFDRFLIFEYTSSIKVAQLVRTGETETQEDQSWPADLKVEGNRIRGRLLSFPYWRYLYFICIMFWERNPTKKTARSIDNKKEWMLITYLVASFILVRVLWSSAEPCHEQTLFNCFWLGGAKEWLCKTGLVRLDLHEVPLLENPADCKDIYKSFNTTIRRVNEFAQLLMRISVCRAKAENRNLNALRSDIQTLQYR